MSPEPALNDRLAERRDLIATLKDAPCVDCGGRFPPHAMQFDHVRGEKEFNIAREGTRCTVERLYAEIAKCDLVCANCHAQRTWGDRGKTWPIPMWERIRLVLAHEPEASASPDGFRLATCVVPECKRPMVAMWHLWVNGGGLRKEAHMCHACATDIYGAPTPDVEYQWEATHASR